MKKPKTTYRGIIKEIKVHITPGQSNPDIVFCSLWFNGGSGTTTQNFNLSQLSVPIESFIGQRRKHIVNKIHQDMLAYKKVSALILDAPK